MKTRYWMNLLAATGLASISVFHLGCQGSGISGTDFTQAVHTGVLLATEDEEKAQRYSNVASEFSGAASAITPETEAKLGEGVALQAFAQIGQRHQNEQLQRYVNLVGRSLVRQSPRPDLLYSFAVIDSDAPNAFAGPGGYIFVTTGALKLMENESELAGVLAHEIAHVSEKHMLKTYKQGQWINFGKAVAEAKDEEKTKYFDMVDQATDTLFDRGLDQRFEYEADSVGMEIAALTGYDPRGIITFLQKLQYVTGETGGWLRTHPSSASRLQKLGTKLSVDLGNSTGVVQRDRFQSIVPVALQ